MLAIAKTIIFKSFGALCLNYCPPGGVIWNNDGRSCLIIAYFIQTIGTHCSVSNLKLTKSGPYDAKQQHNFDFQSSVYDLLNLCKMLGVDEIMQTCQIATGYKESFNRPFCSKKATKTRMDQRYFVYSSQRSNFIGPTSHNWKRYWSADVDVVDFRYKFNWIK